MALKQRLDDKMWKEVFNFYFIVIILGLLYLILLVTSEPVCYTRVSLDERNRYIKRVDCDGTDKICMQFASSKDVNLGDLLNSPCGYTEDYPFTQENAYGAITCQDVHLPTVNAGFFNCSGYFVGDKCTLTCDDDYYPSATKYAVCEEYDDHKANWTVGKFQCSECNDWNEWNGSEYKYISTRQTWEESRQLCQNDNSHLVTIDNRGENAFVHKVVLHCHQYRWIWIGLNDRNTEGTWKWSDGTVSTYTNWGEGQPDGGDEQDCVYINRDNGKWRDWWCKHGVTYAICERNNSLT